MVLHWEAMNAWHGKVPGGNKGGKHYCTYIHCRITKPSFVWTVITVRGTWNGKHKHRASALADMILRCVCISYEYGVLGMEWIKVLDSSDTHDIMDGKR